MEAAEHLEVHGERGRDWWDLVAVAGAGVIVAGVAMIHVPSAVILGGAMLLAFGLWGARASVGPIGRTDSGPEG